MLPDRDQQRLNEIEQELRSDPDFARRFHEARRRMPRLTSTRTLAAVAAAAALLCLALGEGTGFTVAGLLAAVLFFCHGWSIRAR